MKNYYHLLMETPDGNLSRGMRQLNGLYTGTIRTKGISKLGLFYRADTKRSWWIKSTIYLKRDSRIYWPALYYSEQSD
jgi:hypothetical protein